jgi:hypothetical protein
LTAEVKHMLKEFVAETEKEKDIQVTLKNMSGKQPVTNTHEKDKFFFALVLIYFWLA